MIEGTKEIEAAHLQAAFSWWEYNIKSVGHIWGDDTGNVIANKLIDHLKIKSPEWMTLSDINEWLGGKKKSKDIQEAISVLEYLGSIEKETIDTKGRPGTRIRYLGT